LAAPNAFARSFIKGLIVWSVSWLLSTRVAVYHSEKEKQEGNDDRNLTHLGKNRASGILEVADHIPDLSRAGTLSRSSCGQPGKKEHEDAEEGEDTNGKHD
jgi:hypothetical protein